MPSPSSFGAAVLRVVKAIPAGEVLSYGEVAVRAGSPGGARAVGSIMRRNQDKAVPCHRVVKADGRPGGYNNGGEAVKAGLLAEEGVRSGHHPSDLLPHMLNVGDKAPAFTLKDQGGKERSLKDVKGEWVLIYFYPKDDTPGCTKEACALRDHFPKFKKLGVTVFGVSVDSIKSHGKFAEKYELPFILLADEEKTMVADYGVWGKKKFMGREYLGTNRVSYLVDPKGKVAKVYPQVKPDLHADEVLADLKSLQK